MESTSARNSHAKEENHRSCYGRAPTRTWVAWPDRRSASSAADRARVLDVKPTTVISNAWRRRWILCYCEFVCFLFPFPAWISEVL
ncbi:hypothetical protein ANCCAN_04063 [Ancylostoma caninum]|uniref:Uncharacterized protein n=1 Tax=Ancylostoma caninum TaxID=29170 RepID=A0A368H3H9_ANCCA|nr:hypothetical protein ANCCAN_04063 [Ancylostoma caninum]